MSLPALEHIYRYRFSSAITESAVGRRLSLASTPDGTGEVIFVRGRLVRPRHVADLLRGLGQIVQSRFHTPPAMLGRILTLADPVITSNGDVLRFEAFSGCASTYARVDLLPPALDGELGGRGTTNVDFNAPMRAALARIRDRDQVQISIGSQELELSRDGETILERKVPLPFRWLKSFVEVQAYQARMRPRLEVAGPEASRFLRSLPRGGSRHRCWILPMGRGLRVAYRAGQGSVPIEGLERLKVLEDLAREARSMRVFAEEVSQTSAWVLDFEDSRFHLVLSPAIWRGFSGEGQALQEMTRSDGAAALARVQAALHWQSRLEAKKLADELAVPIEDVETALATLGCRGLCGYDLSEQAYFHRHLPFDLSLVAEMFPRLEGARRLLARGSIHLLEGQGGRIEAEVPGTGVVHRVRLDPAGDRCTCPWHARHRGERGPCKHILAVHLRVEEKEEGTP